MKKAEIGVIGLAVMGENLARNMERSGFCVAVYNIEPERYVRAFSEKYDGKNFIPAYSLPELVNVLERPRKILMMIRAGSPVDEILTALLPLLDPGDVPIDGGNSHYADTQRRCQLAESAGCLYVGMGVSGGEEGALNGPSLMPGGSPAAWELIKPVFGKICAHTEEGYPCCSWVGSGGAGHFVKMVHNGIEYGDMQLICEVYHLMKNYLHLKPEEMQQVFTLWNQGELSSYLIEITAAILGKRDTDGEPLLEHILDAAGQKGTGKWAAEAALEEGVPLTLITEAVFARCLSAQKEERRAASAILSGPQQEFQGDVQAFLEDLRQALYASKLISYAQGYALLRAASADYGWNLDFAGIARLWRGGCIIRSRFLEKIHDAYTAEPELPNLMLAPCFRKELQSAQAGWRRVCAAAVTSGIPVPAMMAALAYYDAYRTEFLPANLLQAQRDYFGAHQYERIDAPRGTFFHTDWTGNGGDTVSSAYQV